MPRTLVAVFETRVAAQGALEALARAGFDQQHLRATEADAADDGALERAATAVDARAAAAREGCPPVAAEAGIVPDTASAYAVPFPIEAGVMPYPADLASAAPLPEDDDGVFGHIRSFFAEIFGTDHVLPAHRVQRYSQAVRAGGAIVRVTVDDDGQAGRAGTALAAAGATHVEELPMDRA
jgi:hypothetical protein